MKYQAFISYKHSNESKQQAVALENALKKYAKPVFRPPIRIFRDEKEITVGSDLEYTIKNALNSSEYLIYLASKEAAESQWIQDEIRTWCGGLNRTDKLVIILIKDNIQVNPLDKTINWEKSDALPFLLKEYLPKTPVFLDMKWAKEENSLDLKNTSFRNVVNNVSARLHNKTPAEMNDEHVRILKKNKRSRNILIFLVCLLAIVSSLATWYAIIQKNRADRKYIEARIEKLVAESYLSLPKDNTRALRLAEAAYKLGEPKTLPNVQQAIFAGVQSTFERPLYAFKLEVGSSGMWAISDSWKKVLCQRSSDLNNIELWDVEKGKLLRIYHHPDAVNSGAISPDEKYILTTTERHVRLWDINGNLIMQGEHKYPDKLVVSNENKDILTECSFSPNQQYILTKDGKTAISLWNFQGEIIWDWPLIDNVSFSPSGKYVILKRGDGYINIYNLRDHIQASKDKKGQIEPQLAYFITTDSIDKFNDFGGYDSVGLNYPDKLDIENIACQFSPTEHQLMVRAHKKIVFLINNDSRGFIRLVHNSAIKQAEYSSNGQRILTLDEAGIIKIWNTNGKLLVEIKNNEKLNKASFINNTNNVVASTDESLLIFSLGGKRIIKFSPLSTFNYGKIRDIVLDPDGSKICVMLESGYCIMTINDKNIYFISEWQFAINERNYSIYFHSNSNKCLLKRSDIFYIYNLDNKLAKYLSFEALVIKTSPYGNYILCLGEKNRINLYDSNCNTQMTFEHERASCADISSDSKMLVIGGNKKASVWKLDGTLLDEFIMAKDVEEIYFLPDRKTIACYGEGTTYLIDLKSKKILYLPHNERQIICPRLSLYKNRMITISRNEVILWQNSAKLNSFMLKNISSADISQNGEIIVASSSEGVVKIWSIGGKLLSELKIGNPINIVRIMPDRKSFIISLANGATQLIGLKGKMLLEIKDAVFCDIAPDGKRIVTKSFDSTSISIWDINGNLHGKCINKYTYEGVYFGARYFCGGDKIILFDPDLTLVLYSPEGAIDWMRNSSVFQLSKEEIATYGIEKF